MVVTRSEPTRELEQQQRLRSLVCVCDLNMAAAISVTFGTVIFDPGVLELPFSAVRRDSVLCVLLCCSVLESCVLCLVPTRPGARREILACFSQRTSAKHKMAVDLLAASRRPLERLLHECSFSQWENIALFLDEGATEAVRWAGGLGFVLEELGISQILDLQVGFGCYCSWSFVMRASLRCSQNSSPRVPNSSLQSSYLWSGHWTGLPADDGRESRLSALQRQYSTAVPTM